MTTATQENTKPTSADRPASPSTCRIYVASLSDCNAGILHGRWIDANQPAEDIHAAIQEMLKASREPIAEEWAIHDFEGFEGWEPREYESIETVARVAQFIDEHGEVFGALLAHVDDIDHAARMMTDGYRGVFDSLAAFAQEWFEEIYSRELDNLPSIVRHSIDWEEVARELEMEDSILGLRFKHEVHVFDCQV